MSGHQTATIGDTVFFWFGANDTSGSGGDGATPLFDVREAGAAASAAPLLSGTPTLLTNAAYPDGCHEVSVAATVGNGFAADDTFAVFCALTIDSQNPTGFVGSCTLTPLAKEAAITALNDVAATDIVSAGAITTSSGAVSNVTTVATTTTNTDMRGTDAALLAASINLTAGAVDNVTTVATTTTNTDMRGTDSALLAADINLTAGAVDNVTLVATTTTNTDVTALNDVAATDIVSAGAITTLSGAIVNVDLVDTTTTNTDMVGTDDALLAASINLTAGAVDNVTLVATTTTNTDMRGTDGANTTAPDNAGISSNGTAIAALNDISTSDVNGEVVDVLTVDTQTLPSQSAPPLTPTFVEMVAWPYKSYRNRETQTATEYKLFADNGTTVDTKATVSDDATTFDKNELVSGP